MRKPPSVSIPVFEGSPARIGRQIAQWGGQMLQRHVAQWGRLHPLDKPSYYRDWFNRFYRQLRKRCPHLVEQIVATARTANIPEEELFAMNFRVWGIRGRHERACSILGFRDPKIGLVVGNTLDDPVSTYQMAEFRPKGQYRFATAWWIGSAWAAHGFNEAGLIVAQSSLAANDLKIPNRLDRLSSDFLQRELLAACAAVNEAEQLVRAWPLRNGVNYLLADKNGQAKLLQCCPIGIAEAKPVHGVWALSNHVIVPALRAKMEAAGYVHAPNAYTACRLQYLSQQFQRKPKPHTVKNLAQALNSTKKFPNCIANPNTAYTFVWQVEHEPGKMHYTDGPAVGREWQTYRFK
ncbi:MAG: hypothetical protein HY360_27345 [Verrucomicrobia bacterium]|nr:hypothetical protein [Verrucomicrobiota bacterium]